MDGELSEPAWEQAVRLTSFSQYQPVDQRPATEPTEVRVLYTAQAIYFGIVATSATPGSVRATLSKRDNIANDDRVTIYLDTFHDRRRALFFGANALGVQVDGVRTEGAMSAGNLFGGSVDLNPDFRFETRGRITTTGYVVEMRIPFKSIRFPSADVQQWGIQVLRSIPGRGAEDTWTDAQRGAASFLSQSGTLTGITQVDRGVVTDIQPFVTQSVTRSAGAGSTEHQFDGGVNVRLGFPAIAIDGTYNPDFSQVESDAGLVTVNERFALFLPERRPFFLEGIDLFATPNQLVYTRTIANPIAGAKVTGKVGKLGLALLSAVDELDGDRDVVNIARLRTDYGQNSVAGLTVTDRRGSAQSNTVVAADTRYVFGGVYYLETQLGQSITEADGDTRTAPVWSASVDRTGRAWGFNYAATGIGTRFQSASGFVPRVGYQTMHGFNRLALFGKPGALIQNFTIFGGPSRIWNYGSLKRSAQQEGDDAVFSFVTLRGGWMVSQSLQRQFFAIDPSVAAGLYRPGSGPLTPWSPAGRLSGLWSSSGTVTTPVFGQFNGSLSAAHGAVPIFVEGARGQVTRLSAALTVRPSPATRLEGTLTHSRIRREAGNAEFARVLIPRLKAEYQPTRALFFRLVSEYRSDRVDAPRDPSTGLALLRSSSMPVAPSDSRTLHTDWLVQYEPSSGTTAFVGYGDRWGSAGPLTDTALRRRSEGFFLKVTYLFRR